MLLLVAVFRWEFSLVGCLTLSLGRVLKLVGLLKVVRDLGACAPDLCWQFPANAPDNSGIWRLFNEKIEYLVDRVRVCSVWCW